MYIASYLGGVVIMDISDPDKPSYLGHYDDIGAALDIRVQGDYAYVAFYSEGFVILDVSNPENITKVGQYKEVSSRSRSIDVYEDLAFTGDWNYNFDIYNVSDLSNPQLIYRHNFGEYILHVTVNDSYAFVGLTSGMRIMNIIDPLTTHQIASYTGANRVYDLIIEGNYGYLAAGNFVQTINFTDIYNPTLINSTDFGYGSIDLDKKDDLLYNAGYTMLEIISVNNLSKPVKLSELPIESYISCVAVNDNFVYLADNYDGIVVANVTDPYYPSIVTTFDFGGDTYDVFVEDGLAYLANYFGGLYILDVSNPFNPSFVSQTEFEGSSYISKVAVHNNLAYVSLNNSYLGIINVSNPNYLQQTHHKYLPRNSKYSIFRLYTYGRYFLAG